MLKGVAGIGAAGAVGGVVRLTASPAGNSMDRGLVLSSHETPGMGTLEVPIDSSIVQRSGEGQWRSRRLPTSTFTMVAFIWSAGSIEKPTFRIRSRGKSGWGPWTPVPPLHGGADDASPQSATHTGTELVWVGRADGIQLEVNGARPPQLELVLLHPLARKGDVISGAPQSQAPAPGAEAATQNAQQLALLRPEILTRAAWGADERWRSDSPELNSALQQVHIHHTASGNDYTAAAVPALLRGFYRYHTHNLGWSDIGYNFLVDRFGRIWEGRAGGVDRPVRGAHTRGFNATSTGVAVIGNFDQVTPAPTILAGVAAVAAWKVYSFSGDPAATTAVTSEGSDKYRPGKKVALPVIDGHRDTNDTACPGRHLYAALPTVREQVTNAISKAWTASHSIVVVEPAKMSGNARVGETLSVAPGSFDPASATVTYTWLRNGTPIPGATSASYTCGPADLGAQLAVKITAAQDPRPSVTQSLSAARPTTGTPILRIKTRSPRRGRAAIKVRVIPPAGVEQTATGRVAIKVGDRTQRLDLVDGLARAVFRGLPSGTHKVKVRFRGGGGLEPAQASWTVRVR